MFPLNKASLALLLSALPCVSTLELPASGAAAAPIVTTSLGKIMGVSTDDGRVDAFLGIRYAIVGDRFTRSTLVDQSWAVSPFRSAEAVGGGALDAANFGPICWQDPDPGWGPKWDPESMDEECLYLNVWRPSSAGNSKLPLSTMVWIHGGGLTSGSGSDLFYNGAKLALKGSVIVVTINYRLGTFGYLAKDANGSGGMNGIDDQINALKWVNKHIESFGGKASDITIFGESAGSMSAALLSVSPLAKGLFQRAILQSGAAIAGWGPLNAKEGATLTKNTLMHHGAQSVEELADRTRYPADTIYTWDPQFNFDILAAWPDQKIACTIDGLVIPDRPYELFKSPSKINAKDMMIGSTSYDGVYALLPEMLWAELLANYPSILGQKYGEESGNDIYNAYSPKDPPFNGSPHAAFIQMDGDYQVRCPSRELAALAARGVSGKVFLFNFAHFWDGDPVNFNTQLVIEDPNWASHGSDVSFVFGTAGLVGNTKIENPEDLALSEEIMRRWASFAKTGDPNYIEEISDWIPIPDNMPLFSNEAADIPSMLLQGGGSEMISPDTKSDQCSLLLPAYNFSDIAVAAVESTSNANYVGANGLAKWTVAATAGWLATAMF